MADTVQEQVRAHRDLQEKHDLTQYLPVRLRGLSNLQTEIPKLAKDSEAVSAIAAAVDTIPTEHHLHLGDSRWMFGLAPESGHRRRPDEWIFFSSPDTAGTARISAFL